MEDLLGLCLEMEPGDGLNRVAGPMMTTSSTMPIRLMADDRRKQRVLMVLKTDNQLDDDPSVPSHSFCLHTYILPCAVGNMCRDCGAVVGPESTIQVLHAMGLATVGGDMGTSH